MNTIKLLILTGTISVISCDAQEPAKPSPAEEQNKEVTKSTERMSWIVENTLLAQKTGSDLGDIAMKLGKQPLGDAIIGYSNAWNALNASFMGVFRLEQLLATTPATKEQREIVAHHYSNLAIAADFLAIHHSIPRILELSPADEKDLRRIQKLSKDMANRAWTYCDFLSHEVAAKLKKETEIQLKVVEDALSGKQTINDAYKGVKKLEDAYLEEMNENLRKPDTGK
jgi:pyruvate/2-oxoglutarate dehydrogenase complex dihydrolipoamide acyltransferase (E2) component